MITLSQMTEIEASVLNLLNTSARNIVSTISMRSPRAVGDAIQEFLGTQNGLKNSIPSSLIQSFENDFARRSMEDMAFLDNDGCYFAIDTKTHNLGTLFNMPNLISVKRLANFYKNDTNFFCIFIVEYRIIDNSIEYTACHFRPIESFSWDCLTLGALGWGQIQIANANKLIFSESIDRKAWMLKLCEYLEQFYDMEIDKINNRKLWFSDIKTFWENK